jgi:hypothetical protein
MYWTHHGFDGTADERSCLYHPSTPWTGDLLTVVFTPVDMHHDRLGQTAGVLLAQVPHRGGHLHEGGRRLVPLLCEGIAPVVKACMELLLLLQLVQLRVERQHMGLDRIWGLLPGLW